METDLDKALAFFKDSAADAENELRKSRAMYEELLGEPSPDPAAVKPDKVKGVSAPYQPIGKRRWGKKPDNVQIVKTYVTVAKDDPEDEPPSGMQP